MAKKYFRDLWLELRFDVPPGISRHKILETLRKSINRGDYEYPKTWRVAIGWRNKEEAEMKWGEFTKEMSKSADSSEGWDLVVLDYIEKRL